MKKIKSDTIIFDLYKKNKVLDFTKDASRMTGQELSEIVILTCQRMAKGIIAKDKECLELLNVLIKDLDLKDKKLLSTTPYGSAFWYIGEKGAPIIEMDNPNLLSMLLDTDIPTVPLYNLELPFDEFLIILNYKGYKVEAAIIKHIYNEDYSVKVEGLNSGDYIYSCRGFIYSHNGIRTNTLQDFDFTSIGSKFKTEPNMPLHQAEILGDVYHMIYNSFIYMSTERTLSYLNKKEPLIRKNKLKTKKTNKSYPTKLFNDIRYITSDSTNNTNSNSGKKVKSHLRRGHFRFQPYGPRDNPSTKSIWIQPTYIGVEKMENPRKKLN